VEIVEIRDHPWFLGCQFHPEFKSRPLAPHPLFRAFIDAAYRFRKQRLGALTQPMQAEAQRAAPEELPAAGIEARNGVTWPKP